MLKLYADASPLHRFLADLYPDVIQNPRGRFDCWLVRILKDPIDHTPPLSEAIEVVGKLGYRPALVRRMATLHDNGPGHLWNQHDRNVQDALNEAFGFGWAISQGWAQASYEGDGPGTPDVRIAGENWLEIKLVHNSDDDRRNMRQSLISGLPWSGNVTELRDGFFNKLEYHFAKAAKQFDRVSAVGRLLFIVMNVDTPQMARLSDCYDEIRDWLRSKRVEHPGVGLLVVPMLAWAEPVQPIFEMFDPRLGSAVI